MIKRLGFANTEKGWSWVSGWNFTPEKWNGEINFSGRKSIWLGLEVSLGFNSVVSKGGEISNGLRVRGNELWGNDDWNSVLVYKYGKDMELKNHIDRDVFDKKVVLINFCKVLVAFNYGGKVFWLKNGEIIEFDNSVLHGVSKVASERFSVSFRKVINWN